MRSILSLIALMFCIAFFMAIGCAQPGPKADALDGDSFQQLSEIGAAYIQYLEENEKAPDSKDAILPLLGDETSFSSARDGQEFVILWGTQFSRESSEPLVIGYEAVGNNGSRMVLTSMGPMSMNDQDFLDAKFPDGHTPK